MALSRLAAEFAAEIKNHDWSDAPWRLDRAGHDRSTDSNRGQHAFGPDETASIRTNVMWVVAQVLGHADPQFDPYEFAEACGVRTRTRRGELDGYITAGLRMDYQTRRYAQPGTWTSTDRLSSR